MQWTKMTKTQQDTARTLRGRLADAGVETSVSQVAKYFDEVMRWTRGDLTLDALCEVTGWTRPEPTPEPEPETTDDLAEVRSTANDVGEARRALQDALSAHRAAIIAADRSRDGKGRNELVRAAEGGLSRPKVFETLGVADLESDIRQALRDFREDVLLYPSGPRMMLSLMDGGDGEKVVTLHNMSIGIQDDLKAAGLKVVDLTDEMRLGESVPEALARGAEVAIERQQS